MGSISHSDPEATFGCFAGQLHRRLLVYLHIIEPHVMGVETIHEGQAAVASTFLRGIYKGPIITAGGFDRAGGEAIVARGDADLVAFGRHFTSNPDLPERLRRRLAAGALCARRLLGWEQRHYTDFPRFEADMAVG